MSRIAVLGSSPIMLIAAHYLAGANHSVTSFEEKPIIGGAWAAPGLFGLKHQHANLIVAYNDEDLTNLEAWKNFMFNEMGMKFKRVPRERIKMSTDFHTSFAPEFQNAYCAQLVPVKKLRVISVSVEKESVKVNGEIFDFCLVPAFCSVENFTINSMRYEFPFDNATSLHVVCEDYAEVLKHVYVEENGNLFDRYFKNMETGIFVARVERALKAMPRNEITAKFDKQFQFLEFAQYTSYYRNPARFKEFKKLKVLSGGRINVLDTRQFCWGLRDVSAISKLGI